MTYEERRMMGYQPKMKENGMIPIPPVERGLPTKKGSSRIAVYFVNNNKAEFDREKICFRVGDGTIFELGNNYQDEDDYANLVVDGRTMINWDNVCFVKECAEQDDDL